MAELRFRVLGPLEAVGAEGPLELGSPRQQIALALLLALPNRVVSTDRLIEEIWAENPPERAKHSLQTYVSNLRRLLTPSGEQFIRTERPGYVLAVERHQLDSLRFADLVDDGRRLLPDRPAEAAGRLREALALWRGYPFAGFADEVPMLRDEAGRLEELRLVALEQRIAVELQLGEHDRLAVEIEALTRQYPLRERFWALLMTALYRSGRQADALRAFGQVRRLLGEELGIDPSLELRSLEERILLHDPELAAPPAPAQPRTNLPTPVSTFVGREREVEDLRTKLIDGRLVTVTGPGGIGKTRLAIEVASRLIGAYGNGAWLVDLAPLADGSLIATEILGILGLDAPIRQTHLEALCNQLAPRSVLLVVDNCEHLAGEVARVVAAVLRRAPKVSVLATSRRALGVMGEVVWSIGPLTLPTGDDVLGLLDSEAGQLFFNRGLAIRPAFAVTEENSSAIAEVCRHLDGLPLAIELAAVNLRSLSPTEIEQRLGDVFRLLARGDPTALPRQQTLLATLQWSYDLLDERPRELYRRLAVFVGGFTLQAAEAVGASQGISAADLPHLLDDLVTQSLVVADHTHSGTRFRMLETIRAHGLKQLRETGGEDSAQSTLLQWVVELVEDAGRRMSGPEAMTSIRGLQEEHDNIRAALSWALEHDPVIGLKVTLPLARFWWLHPSPRRQQVTKGPSYLHEGASWSLRMLEAAGDMAPDKLRALALSNLAGRLELRLGRVHEAEQHLRQAESLLKCITDPEIEGWVAYHKAWVTWGRVSIAETVALTERALERHREAGNRLGMLGSTLWLGYALLVEGERPHEAIRLIRRAHRAAAQAGTADVLAHTTEFLAIAGSLHDIGEDVPALLESSLRIFSEAGFQPCIAHVFQTAALFHANAGDFGRAAQLLGAAQGIRDRLATVAPAIEDRSAWVLERGRGRLDDEDWKAAFAAGRAFGIDEAISFALGGLTANRRASSVRSTAPSP